MLDKLLEIKAENKRRLSAYLYQTQNISLDPESIFDIQAASNGRPPGLG